MMIDRVFDKEYVLITAARNEEAYIAGTIESVITQTILPKKWVVVSDGSTDGTDKIVNDYSIICDFIQLIRVDGNNRKANFASKVNAINVGYQQVRNLTYDFIGNLDADVTFESDYYESILRKFQQSPRLGIAGGFIHERSGEHFKSRQFNYAGSVAGAIQLFQRECYEAIGGHLPIKTGGEDWATEVMARMKGWEVEAFPEIIVYHHKQSKVARGTLRESIRQGLMDYSLGSHPFFEIMKCLRRAKEKPYLLVSSLRLCSFILSYCRRQKREVSDEFIRYLRKEQLERLRSQIPLGKKSGY